MLVRVEGKTQVSDPVKPATYLDVVRADIDQADDRILAAVLARGRLVDQAVRIKKYLGLAPVDLDREAVIRARWRESARRLEIPEAIADAILDAIRADARRRVDQST